MGVADITFYAFSTVLVAAALLVVLARNIEIEAPYR